MLQSAQNLTLTLVAGYSAPLRKAIIDRWMELEACAARPQVTIEGLLADPHKLLSLATSYAERAIELEAKVEEMQDDVTAHARLTKSDGDLCVTEAAKALGMRPKDLFEWLKSNGWLYKRANSAHWLGYQAKCNQGLVCHKTTTVTRADGSEKITEQARITPKGLSALAKLIKPIARLI